MDGIRDHQLIIENMTREQICRILDKLTAWSMNTPFYPGKGDHVNYEMIDQLCNELELRMSAE